MNQKDIAKYRLQNQQISVTNFKTVKKIVGWMGAMQAQDYNMAKWGIGVRLPKSTEKIIEAAIDKGKIIRTHLLRPTWHFVSSDDIYWILELTASRIKASLKSRNKQLELTDKIFTKSNKILEKALADGNHLTRNELLTKLKKAKIPTHDNRSSHLLLQAELDGIICSGASKEKQITYALLNERVPKTAKFKRDEAAAKPAERYFTSHGPATLHDFVWWSGLSVTDARKALEEIKSNFNSEKIEEKTYWFVDLFSKSKKDRKSVFLLPAFDEYIISYKDRSAAITFENHKKAISSNGIFRPVVVINGTVGGIWNRTINKDKVFLEILNNTSVSKSQQKKLISSAKKYGRFIEKDVEVKEM
ncbi:MAG: winged helix DNA-binding domain-containing protein [Ignavibacteriaceae bacterium]